MVKKAEYAWGYRAGAQAAKEMAEGGAVKSTPPKKSKPGKKGC